MQMNLPSAEWPKLCQRISQERAGAQVKLEVLEKDGVKKERVSEALLESLDFDNSDACNDVILLRMRGNRDLVHEMIDPIRVVFHPSGTPNDFNPIQIEAENGISLITLHPAIHLQMLEGVL